MAFVNAVLITTEYQQVLNVNVKQIRSLIKKILFIVFVKKKLNYKIIVNVTKVMKKTKIITVFVKAKTEKL